MADIPKVKFILTGIRRGQDFKPGMGKWVFKDGVCYVDDTQEDMRAARNILSRYYEAYPEYEARARQEEWYKIHGKSDDRSGDVRPSGGGSSKEADEDGPGDSGAATSSLGEGGGDGDSRPGPPPRRRARTADDKNAAE